jgi:hypothetical protein
MVASHSVFSIPLKTVILLLCEYDIIDNGNANLCIVNLRDDLHGVAFPRQCTSVDLSLGQEGVQYIPAQPTVSLLRKLAAARSYCKP